MTQDARETAARLAAATDLVSFHTVLRDAWILGPDPRFIQLEMDVSNRCNIRCTMCYHGLDSYVRSRPVFVTADRFGPLAAALLPYTGTLTLSLGSEPLTSPHFKSILEAARPYGVAAIGFYTNGTLLDGAAIETVVNGGVTKVCVSIDGATARTYEAIRRGASFDAVIGNVKRLIARRDRTPRRLPAVRFDVVLMRSNIRELPGIVELAASLGVDSLNFFHMVSYDGLGMERESLRRDPDRSDHLLTEALSAAREAGIPVESHPRLFSDHRGAIGPERQELNSASGPYCLYPFFQVSMNSAGAVPACPFSHGVEPFGALLDGTPFESVWLGPRFTELRTRILTSDPPEMCLRCPLQAARHPRRAAFFTTRAVNPNGR